MSPRAGRSGQHASFSSRWPINGHMRRSTGEPNPPRGLPHPRLATLAMDHTDSPTRASAFLTALPLEVATMQHCTIFRDDGCIIRKASPEAILILWHFGFSLEALFREHGAGQSRQGPDLLIKGCRGDARGVGCAVE